MKKRILVAVTILFLCFAMILSACGGSGAVKAESEVQQTEATIDNPEGETVSPRKTEANTLTIGTLYSISTFNLTVAPCQYNYLVYETLVTNNLETGELECNLAESYEFTDDTTLRIVLRNDVSFSNGDPLAAEDVLWSLSYIASGLRASYYAKVDFENSYCEDEHTAVLKFSQPNGAFLNTLAVSTFAGIMEKSVCENMSEEDWWSKPVGTGPYVVEESIQGTHTIFAKSKSYWNDSEAYSIEKITMKSYSDATTMFIDFENGALDVCTNIPTSDVARLVGGSIANCSYEIGPNPDVATLDFNENNEVLADVRVREAIANAVDFTTLATVTWGNLYIPATSSLPAAVAYHKDLGSYTYDVERAKQLLAETGYTPEQLTFNIVLPNISAQNGLFAECLQGYLQEVGITLEIEQYDLMTCVEIFMSGGSDISMKTSPGGVMNLDPTLVYDTLGSDSNNLCVRITDPTFAQYLTNGAASTDASVRAENYEAAQTWLYENYWALHVAETASCIAYRDYIESVPYLIAERPLFQFTKFKG